MRVHSFDTGRLKVSVSWPNCGPVMVGYLLLQQGQFQMLWIAKDDTGSSAHASRSRGAGVGHRGSSHRPFALIVRPMPSTDGHAKGDGSKRRAANGASLLLLRMKIKGVARIRPISCVPACISMCVRHGRTSEQIPEEQV